EELNTIISEDPFYANEVATYEIIEFQPTKTTPFLKDFVL
ncbi:MAG: GTP cyclohydrolase, partial [Pseudopedobacter saltans]